MQKILESSDDSGSRSPGKEEMTKKNSLSLSKIELNIRNRKFISEESVNNLIKTLEIQLQRLDINISIDKNCQNPNFRILEAVKKCVDEILEVKEKFKMNSFISTYSEHDPALMIAEMNAKVNADKLIAAEKQSKHYERLLKKKEKMIIEREEELNLQREIIERSKEQLEITKSRLQSFENTSQGKLLITPQYEDNENVKSLASRLASEKKEIEAQQLSINQNLKKLKESIEKFEATKIEVNELIEQNNQKLENLRNEKSEILETKEYIEQQKIEILETAKRNDEILDLIADARRKIKIEEEELHQKRIELESNISKFNDEKNEFFINFSSIQEEREQIIEERNRLNEIKEKLGEERTFVNQEHNSLREIKEQSKPDITAKENEIKEREEELERSIADLKIQIDSFNNQIQKKEMELQDREEKLIETEKNIKISLANFRLIEMSLIESKKQFDEIHNTLIVQIENCYEELQQILQESYSKKLELEKDIDRLFLKSNHSEEQNSGIQDKIKNDSKFFDSFDHPKDLPSKTAIQELMYELQEKLEMVKIQEEELQRQKIQNLIDSETIAKVKLEIEEARNKFEVEMSAEKEKVKINFAKLENSMKIVKNKENDLLLMREQLQEKEELLNLWETDLKSR